MEVRVYNGEEIKLQQLWDRDVKFVLLRDFDTLKSELSAKDEKLNKAIVGLKQADEKMRLARQTAFESMFRDILWKGTEEVVKLLSDLETQQHTPKAQEEVK
jgi:hypothetical protein